MPSMAGWRLPEAVALLEQVREAAFELGANSREAIAAMTRLSSRRFVHQLFVNFIN